MTTLHEAAQQGERQPVASLYIGKDGDREIDDWKCELPAGRYELYAAPVSQGERQPVQSTLFDCDIQPRPLAHQLRDYHLAPSEGPLNYTWQDKPHRLLYDLIAAVKYYAAAPAAQPTWREELLVKEMRYIAGISNGQVQRVAERVLEKVKDAPAAQPQDDRMEGALRIQMKRNGQWQEVTKMEEVVNTAEYRRGIRDACEQFAVHDGNTYADMVLEHFGLKEKEE